MYAILNLLNTIISIFSFALLVYVILSWLIQFGVINGHNQVVATFNDVFTKLTDPLLRPFRRFQRKVVPTWQLDLSPILLLLALHFVSDLLRYDIPRLFGIQ
jgi:YggT family protein